MTALRATVALTVLVLTSTAASVAVLNVGRELRPPATPRAVTALPSDPVVPVALPTLERASRSTSRPAVSQPAAASEGPRSSGVPAGPVRARHLAARAGGYDTGTAVADCESGERLGNGRAVHYSFQLRAHDPNSTASGKYSFLDSTWEWVTGTPAPAANYSEATQDAAFRKLWDHGNGASHWYPSRSCWAGVA